MTTIVANKGIELPCVRCGYDLRAHPAAAVCPECGTESLPEVFRFQGTAYPAPAQGPYGQLFTLCPASFALMGDVFRLTRLLRIVCAAVEYLITRMAMPVPPRAGRDVLVFSKQGFGLTEPA